MSEFEHTLKDVLWFAHGTAKMAQDHLENPCIKRNLRAAVRILRKASTISELEYAASKFRKLYKEILEIETVFRDRLGRNMEDIHGTRESGGRESGAN